MMSPTENESELVLSKEQIDEFLVNGVLVVNDILSPTELDKARDGLQQTLTQHGVDTNNLETTGHALEALSSTNGSGGVLDLFYDEWKMQVASNPRLFHATCQLWEAAYCHEGESLEQLDDDQSFKWHPYGPFDCRRGFMYIDRIGYRVPTALAKRLGSNNGKKLKPIQRSLTPHLDCCPDDFFSETASKWRPIQCFVSLTDNLEANTGGFEAARGFHKEFSKWKRPESTVIKKSGDGTTKQVSFPAPCIGEYTHIRPKEDAHVMARIQHIPVRAGSAVFWDNRIPHANAYRNDANKARAVVYCSFLPNVALNRAFVEDQLYKYKRRIPPTDQWINTDENENDTIEEECNEDYERDAHLSNLGRKLLGLDSW